MRMRVGCCSRRRVQLHDNLDFYQVRDNGSDGVPDDDGHTNLGPQKLSRLKPDAFTTSASEPLVSS